MIRNAVRQWLGLSNEVPADPPRAERIVVPDPRLDVAFGKLGALQEEVRGLKEAIRPNNEVDARLRFAIKKFDMTLTQVRDLHCKFDALADALGVTIVVDPEAPHGAVLVSTREDGLLKDGRAYVDAVAAVMVTLQTQERLLAAYARESHQLLSPLRRASPR